MDFHKLNYKSEEGISKVAIIIIVAVVVILLIAVGIGTVILVNNKNKQEQENAKTMNVLIEQNTVTEDVDVNVNKEVKDEIKNEYLNKFSLIINQGVFNLGDEQKNYNASLIDTAITFIERTENNNKNTTINTNAMNTNTVVNDNTSSVINNNTEMMMNNTDTIMNNSVTGDSQILNNNSVANQGENIIQGQVSLNQDNTKDLKSAENIHKAITEITGQNINGAIDAGDLYRYNPETKEYDYENYNQANAYVTEITDFKYENDIYDITYKCCFPTKEQILSKETDRMQYAVVNIKLKKNINYEYSKYQIVSIQAINVANPIAYHLSAVNGKYGVIDENGNVVLENMYKDVEIPNMYKDIFVCTLEDGRINVLNSKSEILYKDYENIRTLRAKKNDTEYSYAEILTFVKNGRMGAIDFDGFEVFKPEYDNIEKLNYIDERIILTKNNEKSLADINGDIITNNKTYTKIGVLGVDFDSNTISVQDQNSKYIIGQDSNMQNSIIEAISADFAVTQFNYEYKETIADWILVADNGRLCYKK